MKSFFYVASALFVYSCHAAHFSGNDLDLLFHYIGRQECGEIKKIMKEKVVGVDVYCPSRRMTPLQCAAHVGNVSVFKYLLTYSTITQTPQHALEEHDRLVLRIAQQPGREKIWQALKKKLK